MACFVNLCIFRWARVNEENLIEIFSRLTEIPEFEENIHSVITFSHLHYLTVIVFILASVDVQPVSFRREAVVIPGLRLTAR